MKLAALTLAFLSSSPCLAGACLTYTGSVTLKGVLSRQTFAEQPNYESIAHGDAAATYFFISTAAPFCVAAGTPEQDEPAARGVRHVQLVFPSGKSGYDPLRRFLGKQVVCNGTLFHAITGHHHSTILLSEAACRGGQS